MKSGIRTFSKRDVEILLALLHRVRIFSQRQLIRHWWMGEAANARRRLDLLTTSGLLNRISVSARAGMHFTAPVVTWRPGEVSPNFGAVSYRLTSRWKKSTTRTCAAYVATDYARRLLGGSSRVGIKSGTQATHDLAVSAIWLRLREQNPSLIDKWYGEDAMSHTRFRQKLPDVFFITDDEKVESVLEFGGSYSAERVRDFHADCEARSLPYQIW